MSLPIFQTGPLLSASRVALISSCLVSPFSRIGADERDFFADVFVEEFGGLQEIVFVILFENAELVGFGEGAKMHGGGIYGGGDVFEFQVENSAGQV